MGNSFGYNREETDAHYSSAPELIHELADTVARGGNLLLAVGPTATGSVPWSQGRRLLEIGWWLRENGQAIYESRPWSRTTGTTGDQLDVRYTETDEAVYAITLGAPTGSALELDVALADGAEATLNGSDGPPLRWERTRHGTRFELPEVPDRRPTLSLRLTPGTAVRPT